MNEPYRELGKVYPVWEHHQEKVSFDDLDDTMKRYGDVGWELVTACRIDTNTVKYRLFFKRMK